MWLKLSDGSLFNTDTARSLRIGSPAGAPENEWAVLADLPDGESVTLAEHHSPQAAQKDLDPIVDCLSRGERILALG